MNDSSLDYAQALVEGLRAFDSAAPDQGVQLVTQAQRALEAGHDEVFALCETQLLKDTTGTGLLSRLRQLRARATSVAPLIDAPHDVRRTLAVAVQLRGTVLAQCACPSDGHRDIATLFETLLALPCGAVWSLPGLFSDEALAGLSDVDWYRLTQRFARWRIKAPAVFDAFRVPMPAHGESAPTYVSFVLLSLPADPGDLPGAHRLREALDALSARQLVVPLGQDELACRALVLAGGDPRHLVHDLLYAAEHAQLSQTVGAALRMVGGNPRALRACIGPTAQGLVRVLLATTVTHESLVSVEYPRARWPQLLAMRAVALLSGAGIRDVQRFSEPERFERVCQDALERAHALTRAAGTTRH
jgi:hypothetical protein